MPFTCIIYCSFMHSSLHELAFHANFSDGWIHQKDNQEIFFILTNTSGNIVLPYLFSEAYRIAVSIITGCFISFFF